MRSAYADFGSPAFHFCTMQRDVSKFAILASRISASICPRTLALVKTQVSFPLCFWISNQYHQLCWWSVFAPPGLTGAFPPKGGLANRSYITGGRLKAAPFLTTFRDLLPVDPFRTVLQYTS